MQTSEGKKGKKTKGNKAHLVSTLVSHTGKHFSWWLQPRIVSCKKSEAFGSSSYFLNILSELSILLASCSPNTLCCPYIYQSLISVLFTTPCSAVWPSWIQWQSFHIQVMPLQHLSNTRHAMNQADQQNWPLISPFVCLSLHRGHPWILTSSAEMGIATICKGIRLQVPIWQRKFQCKCKNTRSR